MALAYFWVFWGKTVLCLLTKQTHMYINIISNLRNITYDENLKQAFSYFKQKF